MTVRETAGSPTMSDWLLVALLGLIWGATFMSMAIALEDIGPFWVAAGRILLAVLALAAVTMVARQRLPGLTRPGDRRVWRFAAAVGLFCNAVPFFLLAWGQQYVASSFAGIAMAAVPLFVIALAHFLLPGERITAGRLAGFAMGLAGVALLTGGDILANVANPTEALARAACVASAASYAVGFIMTRRAPPSGLIGFSLAAQVVAATVMLPLALVFEGLPDLSATHADSLAALAYLGLGPTAAATLIVVQVIRSAGPPFLTQVNYHVPIWAVGFGTLFLAEPLPPEFLAALGLILGGLAVSRARFGRRSRVS